MVKYVYTLGAGGERVRVEELDRTVEYTYDSLYRLTSETITEGDDVSTYAYEYDSVSNRTLKNVDGNETVYSYNALNQLVSDSDSTYEYDNAGNLVRVIGSGKTALYEYNAENKLVKATVQQGNVVTEEIYTYDYSGNRTSKTTTTSDGNVEYVKYLNDNSSLTNVLAEIGNDGEVIYTVGADLISQEIDGEVYVYLYDGHGTVRALADEEGKITDTYSYDAFGNLISSTGSTENKYLYCGEQYDSTTGLYYLRARYMDTSTGRFISMDTYQGTTADPISLHKYLYANSNPVMYTDPSGYSVENDTYYYQQAWMTIDQAQDYIRDLACSSSNEISYNAKVVEVGLDIIRQLTMTAVEYVLASFLEQFVTPEFARIIANGLVSAFDMTLKGKNAAVSDELGVTKTKQQILDENRKKGANFEKQKIDELSEKLDQIFGQVTIKVKIDNDKYIKTRVDAIDLDKKGNVVIYEFKSSPTAPLTQNQKKAFPILQKDGGVIVGKGKGEIFKGGVVISPTEVEVIRP
ncbi:MAG: hypothetical protein IJN43_16475 [Ruminococcus sp.]|nr:hypothetical protein [Ruminococcus sp.]